jgi:hypothetical protein
MHTAGSDDINGPCHRRRDRWDKDGATIVRVLLDKESRHQRVLDLDQRSQGVHDLDAVIKPFPYDPCILSYLGVLLAIYLFPAIAKIHFSTGFWILIFVLVGLTFLLCASIRAPGSVRIGHA